MTEVTTRPPQTGREPVRAEAFVHRDGTGTFTLEGGPVQLIDAGTPAAARTEVLRLAAAAAGEAGRPLALSALVEGEHVDLEVTPEGVITAAEPSSVAGDARPLNAEASVDLGGIGHFLLEGGPVQLIDAGTTEQARTEVLRHAAAAAGEAGRTLRLTAVLDGETTVLEVAPDGTVRLTEPPIAPELPAAPAPAPATGTAGAGTATHVVEPSSRRHGKAPIAAGAGLVIVAVLGGVLLRGCDDGAPAPRAAAHTASAAATSSTSPTAAASSATATQIASPIVADLAVRALTPAGGPLTLILTTAPAPADRTLAIKLRAAGPHGRAVATRTLTLPAGHGTVRAAFRSANAGAFSWQISGAGFQPVTGTATVAAAPVAPGAQPSTGATYRPPTHTTTTHTTTSSGSTSHHSSPTHHAKTKTQPPKISISVPPSPIDRAASREGMQ